MLKKIIGLTGCVALTLTFTGCPAEESTKGPNVNASDTAKENAEAKAAEADAAADDATKAAEGATDGE